MVSGSRDLKVLGNQGLRDSGSLSHWVADLWVTESTVSGSQGVWVAGTLGLWAQGLKIPGTQGRWIAGSLGRSVSRSPTL